VYRQRVDDVIATFDTDERLGLSDDEARSRLERFGRNALAGKEPIPAWRRFLAQFEDVLVLLLLVATAISAGLWVVERDAALPYEALVIFAIVLLNAAILGFPPEQMMARMDQVLAFSELGDFLDQPIKTYSSGMYARLAFSAAINVDPEILIIDEALAVGDARFVAKCMRRIKDIQNQGATILFVSHDVGSVRALCDRAIWLDQGRLVGQGDVFPVTGQFMEFMFRGEETAEDTLYQEIATQQLNAIAPGGGEGSEDPADLPTSSGVTPTEAVAITSSGGVDERPVTHWGSHKGIIVSASVCDERSHRKDVHAWGATIKIIIHLRIPEDLPREHMSIAFSIKDLKGTDLIVSTTHDFAVLPIPDGEALTATFTLVNPLVTGKYLLVAAVENREYRDIHYYEYVEGSHYFSSFSNERFFGLFQPPIEQEVLVQ